MDPTDFWNSFRQKLEQDTLTDADFAAETAPLLHQLLCGEGAAPRRQKFAAAPADIHMTADRISVICRCPDDDYRFDFRAGKLVFIECITLPVRDIVPGCTLPPLPEKESRIRAEKEISRMVWHYLQFKKLAGREKAMEMFRDGAGEVLCARSWVPFYTDRLACIAYAAWTECRINGEDVLIRAFGEERCEILLRGHLWRRVYAETGHLRTMIDYEEYMDLFEYIWTDRAQHAGWKIRFGYTEQDTSLLFERDSEE